jgi:hypothetical protein
VGVGRQAAAGVRQFLAEPVELVFGQPALHEGPRVYAGRGVALEVDLVAATLGAVAAEEVVESDLVQRRGRGVGGDVPADPDPGPLRPVHHDRGVPADVGADAPFDLLIAREPGLQLGRDGVDVVGAVQARHPDVLFAGALQHAEHQVPCPIRSGVLHHRVEGFQPLLGLGGIQVEKLAGQPVADHRLALRS